MQSSIASSRKQVPLGFFGIPFGILGVADCWIVAAKCGVASSVVGESLNAAAAAMWLVVLVGYLRSTCGRAGAIARDLTNDAAGPFGILALLTPMLATADGIYPYEPAFGRTLVDLWIAATVLGGSLYVGQWTYRPPAIVSFHPGYFLPTVAGGFVASASAALVGQPQLAELLFGLGLMSWLIVGSIVFGRLLFGPPLPPALTPTLAVLVAPAGVATFAYLAIDGGRIDGLAAAIAGYGVLMVLAQLRLLPLYRRLPLAANLWAFTFPWAAVAFATMFWLHAYRPPAWQLGIDVLLAVVTVGVGAIGAGTTILLGKGRLFPIAAAIAPSSTGALRATESASS